MPGPKATEATRREEILRAAYDVALRRGIDGLTLRAVAARARLSHGSVLFHFKRKEQLGLALLDRVLSTTLPPRILEVVETLPEPNPRERLLALVRQEVARLAAEPRPIRLLLEYGRRYSVGLTIPGLPAAAPTWSVIRRQVTSLGSGRRCLRTMVALTGWSARFGRVVSA